MYFCNLKKEIDNNFKKKQTYQTNTTYNILAKQDD